MAHICYPCFREWEDVFKEKFGTYTKSHDAVALAFLEFIFGKDHFVFR
jgi:hypothetical protein